LFLADVVHLSAGSSCAIVQDEIADLPVVGSGLLDLALGNRYQANIRFMNLASPHDSGTEISIREVNLTMDWGDFFPKGVDSQKTKQVATDYVLEGVSAAASGGALPGEWGVVEVAVIPLEVGEVFANKMAALASATEDPRVMVSATLTVSAELQDGSSVTSNDFVFPIELCWGCLVDRTGAAELPVPCAAGQEDPLDVETCTQLASHPEVCGTGD